MTVTHIVLIRWAADDPAAHVAVRDAVRALRDSIPEIVDVREGPNKSPEGLEAGFGYGFAMTFADEAARDTYLTHPAHLPVADLIGRAAGQVLVFDI